MDHRHSAYAIVIVDGHAQSESRMKVGVGSGHDFPGREDRLCTLGCGVRFLVASLHGRLFSRENRELNATATHGKPQSHEDRCDSCVVMSA